MRADAAANRRRILAAAGDVFGERGIAAPTDEVARRAGVGVGTVFRHFPAKRDLVVATLASHFDELSAHAADLAATSDATAALHALLREMARTGRTKMSLARGLLTEQGDLPEAAAAASDRLRSTMAGLLDGARAAGEVRPDVGVDEVYYLLHGLSQAQETVPADDSVRRRAVDIVLDGLRPVAPAPTRFPDRTALRPGRQPTGPSGRLST